MNVDIDSTTGKMKSELQRHAQAERRRCAEWLIEFMKDGYPKIATKEEFRTAAIIKLDISKVSFDCAWIWAIEETERHDWYKPFQTGRSGKPQN